MKIKGDFLFSLIILLFLSNIVNTLSPVCKICHFVVEEVQKIAPESPLDKILANIGIDYCSKKHLQDVDVCKGAVTQMIDPILNSIWRRYIDPHLVCHKLYLCPKQYFKRNLTQQLENIVKGKPNKTWQKSTNRKSLKIMHISDLHPDFFYTPGTEANCSQPLCCRLSTQTNSLRTQIKNPAGYWGSIFACDLPIQTFDVFLEEIKRLNLDFIIWTGDNTAHDIWKQSQSYNLNFTTYLSDRFSNALPNVTVIPAMGNHESYPVNVYDHQGKREDMLKQTLAENWKRWIGQKAYQTLKEKGYYAVQFKKLNLKVVSINTQAGNNENWFLIRNPTDPGHMLEWLQSQLKLSQEKNQFVYIIGHIPPNNDNLNDWSIRYNAIIQRYSYTIRGGFFGHTHKDHMGVHYSNGHNDTAHITNYYFVAPSLTTYDYKIPEYRILDVDLDTLQIKDYHQYRLDLRKYQKKEDQPQFELLYNFKQAYGVDDMRPDSGIAAFIEKLKTDEQIQKKYGHYHDGGLATGKAGLNWYCNTFGVPQQVDKCNGKEFKKSLIEKIEGEWRDLKHQD